MLAEAGRAYREGADDLERSGVPYTHSEDGLFHVRAMYNRETLTACNCGDHPRPDDFAYVGGESVLVRMPATNSDEELWLPAVTVGQAVYLPNVGWRVRVSGTIVGSNVLVGPDDVEKDL
ncbi:hypothetical protein [Longispora fulva]|uniref:Uncharacterized protein n=1 Tax=Longispora fulva TaxID=619741 RepID=A0A8J7GL81_9ACTN|nr:hypothetical protein [Longispora fulva]MBG6140261.1 hypothetical protein [Longispora fulva]